MIELFDLHYFPNICYVKTLIDSKNIKYFEYGAHRKMSFLNKSVILGSNGLIKLSVPIKDGRNQKIAISGLQIDYSTKWQVSHWRSIESCYRKSPFFLYYADAVHDLIYGDHESFVELNKTIMQWVLNVCRAEVEVADGSEDGDEISREYLYRWLPNNFQSAGCGLRPYVQVFEGNDGFQSNLSILDAVFCLGPQLADYVRTS